MELSNGKNFYVYVIDYDDNDDPIYAVAEGIEEIEADNGTTVWTARVVEENELKIKRELKWV